MMSSPISLAARSLAVANMHWAHKEPTLCGPSHLRKYSAPYGFRPLYGPIQCKKNHIPQMQRKRRHALPSTSQAGGIHSLTLSVVSGQSVCLHMSALHYDI